MRGGGEPGIIERWKEIAGTETDNALRATSGAIAMLFAELNGWVPAWQAGLEGWNMPESTVVEAWKAEGRAEGVRGALLVVLGQRLGAPVPADVVAAIEAQADPDILSRWLAFAVTADGLEAFRKAITPRFVPLRPEV